MISAGRLTVRQFHAFPEVCVAELDRIAAAAIQPAEPEEDALVAAFRAAASIDLGALAAEADGKLEEAVEQAREQTAGLW
jgi:hypothetical protein